jgi:hypothetical protein
MIHALAAHERKSCLTNPPPVLDVLVMSVCLQALLGLKVEELESPRLRLESNDRFRQMHDGAISSDRPPHYVIDILEVENNCLRWRTGIVALLAHADVGVGLEGLCTLLAFPTDA